MSARVIRSCLGFGAAALVSCASGNSETEPGRQSGTEDPAMICDPTNASLQANDAFRGVSVAALTSIDETWWVQTNNAEGQHIDHQLRLRLNDARGFTSTTSDNEFCPDKLTAKAGVHVSIDGLMDVQVSDFDFELRVFERNTNTGVFSTTLQVEAPVTADAGAKAAPVSLSLTLGWTNGRYVAMKAQLGETYFHVFRPDLPQFVPSPLVADVCATREPTATTSFASREELMQAIAGDWAVCTRGEQPFPFAGVHVAADMTWNAIDGTEQLALLTGFQREGWFGFVTEDPYLLTSNSPGIWDVPIDGQVRMSTSGNTFGVESAPYAQLVRLPTSVNTAEPVPFIAGERAGVAGCASSEAGIERSTDLAGAQAALEGVWARCDSFGGDLRFTPTGMLTLREASGINRTGRYEVVQALNGITQLTFDNETWLIALSSIPKKAYVTRRFGGDLNQSFVLSAMPE